MATSLFFRQGPDNMEHVHSGFTIIEQAIRKQRIHVKADISRSPADSTVAIITAAGKQLVIEVSAYGKAKTQIENTGNPRSPGETTSVYEVAHAFLEQEANLRGMPLEYELETGFTSMKNWTQTTGEKIFHWDDIHYSIDDPQKLIAHTTIYPRVP